MSAVSIMGKYSCGKSLINWLSLELSSSRARSNEQLSTPPATTGPDSSSTTLAAALATACRPDEQNLLTVAPATPSGRPAPKAAWRATLRPVVPSGEPQPKTTSSMASGSMPARSTAARIAKAANVGPWVILSSPRPALVSGVRAVETITAWRVIAISVFKWVGLFLVSNIGGQFQQTQVVILRAKARIAAQEFAVVMPHRVLISHAHATMDLDALATHITSTLANDIFSQTQISLGLLITRSSLIGLDGRQNSHRTGAFGRDLHVDKAMLQYLLCGQRLAKLFSLVQILTTY